MKSKGNTYEEGVFSIFDFKFSPVVDYRVDFGAREYLAFQPV